MYFRVAQARYFDSDNQSGLFNAILSPQSTSLLHTFVRYQAKNRSSTFFLEALLNVATSATASHPHWRYRKKTPHFENSQESTCQAALKPISYTKLVAIPSGRLGDFSRLTHRHQVPGHYRLSIHSSMLDCDTHIPKTRSHTWGTRHRIAAGHLFGVNRGSTFAPGRGCVCHLKYSASLLCARLRNRLLIRRILAESCTASIWYPSHVFPLNS